MAWKRFFGRTRPVIAVGIAIVLAACSASRAEAPPAPQMPSGWVVASDFEVPSDQIATIERNLGGNIRSLRNTAYDVKGKRVQLNTIVASDANSADKLMASLLQMKSEQAVLRKGLLIYEFVGQNDVLPYIREGRAHIAPR